MASTIGIAAVPASSSLRFGYFYFYFA